ncbi:transposase [Streptomyces sp. NPDC006458]|uniref:transposase n=1 Tax=Streptomyces sp. NPDC006458 TaxID=3154302 RepID=UPI0033B1BC29
MVDTLGLLLAVMVTAASVTDRDAGRTLPARLHERHRRITRVWADGGYTGQLVDFTREVLRVALTVVRRGDNTRRELTAVHRLPARPFPTGQDVHDPPVVRRQNSGRESLPPVRHHRTKCA